MARQSSYISTLLLVSFISNPVSSFDRPYIQLGEYCEYSEQCVLGKTMEEELKHVPYEERDTKFGDCDILRRCCDVHVDSKCRPKAVIGGNCLSDIECRHIPGICINNVCVCDKESSFLSKEGIRSICTCNEGLLRNSRNTDCMKFELDGSWSTCSFDKLPMAPKHCLLIHQICGGDTDQNVRDGYCSGICNATDPYSNQWIVTRNTTGWNLCPFGKPFRSAHWFCQENGLFNGSAPDFSDCSSEWVEDILNNIKKPLQLEFDTSMNLSLEIQDKITSAIEGDANSNIYSHELAPLLEGLKTIAQKFVAKDQQNDNLQLAESILKSVGIILKFEYPWLLLNEEMKSKTFSSLLDTMENAPSIVAQRGCFNESKSNNCKFPFVFESTEMGHCLQKDDSNIDLGIEAKTEQIRNQKSSLKMTLPLTEEFLWVGSSLSSKFTRAYSSQKLELVDSSADGQLDENYETNSDIMTFTLASPTQDSLAMTNLSVEITFWHTNYAWSSKVLQIQRSLHEGEHPTAVLETAQCVFWNASLGAWSSKGCEISSSSSFSTTCVCNHLSAMSLIMKSHSYIGKSPVLLAATLLIILFLMVYLVAKIMLIKKALPKSDTENNKLYSDRSQLLKNFGLLLTLGCYGLIFFLVDKHYFNLPNWACYGVGMIGHFLVFWAVLVLTLELLVGTIDYISLRGFYFIIMRTNQKPNQILIGVPFWISLFFVAIVSILDEFDGLDSLAYGGAFCWIDKPFHGALFIPLWILLGFNYFLLVLVLGESVGAFRERKRTMSTGTGKDAPVIEVITFAKNGLLTNTLVTSTWIIAYFHLGPHDKESKFLSYLFPVVFCLQGILIERLMDKEALINKLKLKFLNCLLTPSSLGQEAVHKVQDAQERELQSCSSNEKDAILQNNPLVIETSMDAKIQSRQNQNGELMLQRCLQRIGCGQYMNIFIDNDIDFNCFKTLTRDELETLLEGKFGPIKKIYAEIQRIRGIDERKKLNQNKLVAVALNKKLETGQDTERE